ncbi:class I SAM-dependent methyltransferase [Streptomyces nigra]
MFTCRDRTLRGKRRTGGSAAAWSRRGASRFSGGHAGLVRHHRRRLHGPLPEPAGRLGSAGPVADRRVRRAGGRARPGSGADLGSGPGAVTAHLHRLGLTVFGVDLSPGMVALARRAHPALRFHVGSMKDVDLTYHWRTPETVAERLAEAGLRVTARVLREPVGEEKRPRAFLLAEKPVGLTPR